MGNVAGMLAAARKLLGTTEHPPGSNHNQITQWYGVDAAWCDMSISYEAAHSDNLAAVCGKFAYTVAHARAFVARGRWHYGLGGARAGDIVFFDWSGTRSIANIDHVGLIEAVHSNATITTLEGNTSDRFLRRVRNASCVVGYGRPAYSDGAPLPPTDGQLRVGSRGKAVEQLQANLDKVMGSKLATDGDFGPATRQAVEAFQRRFKLAVDGVYGPHTAAAMKAALAGHAAPIPPKPHPHTPASAPKGKVGEWIKQATQILQAHGVPASKMNPQDIAIIIDHESGGNPNAENDWDSNAKAGHPSIGLMQTIKPTFDAHKLPGHDNIRNPVDNIIAGVRYAIARYGSISNVPGVKAVHAGRKYVGY